jgi:hypothetical protein
MVRATREVIYIERGGKGEGKWWSKDKMRGNYPHNWPAFYMFAKLVRLTTNDLTLKFESYDVNCSIGITE